MDMHYFCGQSLLVAGVIWPDAITPERVNGIDSFGSRRKSLNLPNYPLCQHNMHRVANKRWLEKIGGWRAYKGQTGI